MKALKALKAKLIMALQDLGASPHAVAISLKLAHCEGTPRGPEHCPVAKYILGLLPEWEVCVNSVNTSIFKDEFLYYLCVRNPQPVEEFIVGFDGLFGDCRFPKLILQ